MYQIIGQKAPLNKPIVGRNAFLHESGIHQHGVLANKKTYEILTPEAVGIRTNNLVLGKHSGRHALETRLKELGFFSGEVSGTPGETTAKAGTSAVGGPPLTGDAESFPLIRTSHTTTS